jgi:hypothetical protein
MKRSDLRVVFLYFTVLYSYLAVSQLTAGLHSCLVRSCSVSTTRAVSVSQPNTPHLSPPSHNIFT